MKKFFCQLAQRRFDSHSPESGLLSKHVDSCPECQSFFKETRSIELELRSAPSPHNEMMCREIMREIKTSPQPVSPPSPRLQPWMMGAGLTTLVAVAIILVALIGPNGTGDDESSPETPVAASVEEPPAVPVATPVQSFAALVQQQEFLRRDARKLGAHLRERVILFQQLN